METILASLAAGIAAVITAIAGYYVNKINKAKNTAESDLKTAKQELSFHKESLGLKVDLHKWNKVEQNIRALLSETEIDRLLILRCWNGETHPKYTTALYQYREDGQDFFSYLAVDLDEDYVSRLEDMKANGVHQLVVDEILEECLIKAIYTGEGILKSIWFPAMTQRLKGSDSCAHTYVSCSTHKDVEIPASTKLRCAETVGLIKEALLLNDVTILSV